VDNYDADRVRRKADLQLTIGFMARGFRPETYYWNSIKMFEKILLVILAVFFPGKVQLQVTSALIISFIFFVLQVQFKPMNSDILNMIESIALLSSCFLFSFGLFFFIPECSNDSTCKQGISLLIAVSILIFMAICLWAFVNQIQLKFTADISKERRKSVVELRRNSIPENHNLHHADDHADIVVQDEGTFTQVHEIIDDGDTDSDMVLHKNAKELLSKEEIVSNRNQYTRKTNEQ
jgi:hypothetical protein